MFFSHRYHLRKKSFLYYTINKNACLQGHFYAAVNVLIGKILILQVVKYDFERSSYEVIIPQTFKKSIHGIYNFFVSNFCLSHNSNDLLCISITVIQVFKIFCYNSFIEFHHNNILHMLIKMRINTRFSAFVSQYSSEIHTE